MNKPKVLITGAASGIGRATAMRFAKEGYNICANDIQEEKLKTLLNELEPGNHLLLPGSYTSMETIDKGQQLISEHWGSLDALVNCAGIGGATSPIEMDIEQWRKIFDIMVNGIILISKLAAQCMNNGGRMIHITSIHGTRAKAGASSYSMAKAAY